MNPGRRINFVSTTQTEASDKINYAKAFYLSIPAESGLRPPVWRDNEFELSLGADREAISVLMSQPASSSIRGGEKDIYFDEFAFVRDARKMYEAAVPATIRSSGRMTVVSTPYGQSGLFFDLMNDRVNYPGYTIHVVPWWECSIMSVDVSESTALAPDLDTETRVKRWGTPALKAVFGGVAAIESFQQEFECSFADESVNFFPWELILGATDETLGQEALPNDIIFNVGIDIAKSVDKTVVTISSHDEAADTLTIWKTFETQQNYDDQIKKISDLVQKIHPQRVTIDATGVGAVIADNLSRKFGGIVEPIVFTNALKERWATSMKGDMQLRRLRMPRERSLMQEIHNIERKKSEAGNYLFRARGDGHDDYMWSACLSLYGRGRVTPKITFAW